MQGIKESDKQLLVLGATNTPWTLDPAFRRRFEKRIFIPLPNHVARTNMFKKFMDDIDHDISIPQFKHLSDLTNNYSGSDISVILRDALMAPVRACQNAKQFSIKDDGTWVPITNFPSCQQCPPSSDCSFCGAKFISMDNIPNPLLLRVPSVSFDDICNSVTRNTSSVGASDLGQYSEWTTLYGHDGA